MEKEVDLLFWSSAILALRRYMYYAGLYYTAILFLRLVLPLLLLSRALQPQPLPYFFLKRRSHNCALNLNLRTQVNRT